MTRQPDVFHQKIKWPKKKNIYLSNTELSILAKCMLRRYIATYILSKCLPLISVFALQHAPDRLDRLAVERSPHGPPPPFSPSSLNDLWGWLIFSHVPQGRLTKISNLVHDLGEQSIVDRSTIYQFRFYSQTTMQPNGILAFGVSSP